MNPIEAGARAICAINCVAENVDKTWPGWRDDARAAAIAMVGELEPRQCLDVLMEAGTGTTDSPFCHERFHAELIKQLTI